MQPRRHRKPNLSPEHLLLLGALLVLAAGAIWVAHSPESTTAGNTRSWLSGLPSLGLPLVHALLRR